MNLCSQWNTCGRATTMSQEGQLDTQQSTRLYPSAIRLWSCGDRRRTAISEWTSRRAMCHSYDLFWCSAGYFRKEHHVGAPVVDIQYRIAFLLGGQSKLVSTQGCCGVLNVFMRANRCGPGEDVGGSINGFVTNPSKGRLLHVTAQLTTADYCIYGGKVCCLRQQL